MATYKIQRFYFRDSVPTKTIKTGLTLLQAQTHCRDKETSSLKCAETEGLNRTAEYGLWFDGYEEE